MKTQTICRIVGRTRLEDRSNLGYIYRERLDGVETYSATDGRALTQIIRPIPKAARNNCLLFERVFFTRNGTPAKRQDRIFPKVKEVYPKGEAAVFELSASELVRNLNSHRKRTGISIYKEIWFLADVFNRRALLSSNHIYIMASNVIKLRNYGFGDTVRMHLYPGLTEISQCLFPVLFTAEGGDSFYRFLVQPLSFESKCPALTQCIKLN